MPRAKPVNAVPVKKNAKLNNDSLLNDEVKNITKYLEKRLKVFAKKTITEYKRK